jgi:DHA3 family tetracycline resistance protein-like MFS transporter
LLSHDSARARRVYLIQVGARSFAFSLIITVNLIWQAQAANLDPLQLVLVGTVLEAVIFVGEVPTGVVADVFGRRRSVVIGLVLYGAGFLLEGLFPVFWVILLGQVLWGTGHTFVSGAIDAWLAGEVSEENLGPLYLRASQVSQAASLVAIPVSVALGNLQLNLPIVIGAALFFLIAVFLTFVMPETAFRPIPRAGRGSWRMMGDTFRGGLREVRAQPVLVTIFGTIAFHGMASEGLDRLFTPYFLRDIGLPQVELVTAVSWFGLISLGSAVLGMAAAEVARRRLDARDRGTAARALFLLSLLQIGGVFAFALAVDFPTALAAYWSLSVFRRVIGPIHGAWLNRGIDPQVRATVLSMGGQADALGQIVGGPLLGGVASALSIRASLVVAGVVMSPALALYVRSIRQVRSVPSPSADESG